MVKDDSASARTAFVMTHESDPNRRRMSMSLIALAVTRSIGRHGVPVVRVHPNRLDHGLSSRYCADVAVCPDMYQSESALVDYLRELAGKYPGRRVLIPASDDCAQFLGKHRGELEELYRIVVASCEVMAIVINKQRQYEQAQRLGVPIPETYFPKSTEEAERVIASAGNYPYIIKPLVAHKWRLASMKSVSKGRKAVLVRNAEELRSAYAAMGEQRDSVMIQEVIGGRDEQLLTFLACFRADSTPIAYCLRKKIRQGPLDFGYCTMTVSCHDDRVVQQSLKLLQGIGYSGICGVEYKLDAKTGEYKLIEINARPVNTISLAPACGVDIPYLAFRDAAGEEVDPVTDWKDGVVWCRTWHDYFMAREHCARGGPPMSEWWRTVRGGYTDPIVASDDLGPTLRYYGDVLGTAVGDKIRRLFGPQRPRKPVVPAGKPVRGV